MKVYDKVLKKPVEVAFITNNGGVYHLINDEGIPYRRFKDEIDPNVGMKTYEVKFVDRKGYDDFMYVNAKSEDEAREKIDSVYDKITIIKIEEVSHFKEDYLLWLF